MNRLEVDAVGASLARAGIAAFLAAPRGEVLWANEVLRRATGSDAPDLPTFFEGLPAPAESGGRFSWPAAGSVTTLRLRGSADRYYNLVFAPWAGAGEGLRFGILVDRTDFVLEDSARREREIWLVRATQDSADAIVSLDNDGRIRYWNDGARRLFGYAAGEVLGRRYDEILVPPDAIASGELESLHERIQEDGYVRGHETRRVARDGHRIPVEVSVSRILDERGNPAGRSVIYRDISERLRLQAELRRTVDELQAANQNIRRNQEKLLALEKLSAVGEMSARVAHEIRTPLVTIGGFANTLMRETPAESPHRRYLEIIREEVRRLEAIVAEILEYVRPPRTDLEDCRLNDILKEAARPFERDMVERQVRAEWLLEADLPTVRVNRYQIHQVFTNLIQNALQAMPAGGTLTLGTSAGTNHVRVTVADTGVGIPEANRRQIFKPFFTTKAAGSGLGLAIASQIVAQNNGTISFDSAEGSGTTFDVRLPLSREPSS